MSQWITGLLFAKGIVMIILGASLLLLAVSSVITFVMWSLSIVF
jgi:hypothetical protein